jgi:hypothetical protein
MPLYKFELDDGVCRTKDETGVQLPDRKHALQYARAVVRELMEGRVVQTRCWRLDVFADTGGRIFEIPFASVDWTLDHLRPELRTMVAELTDRVRSLREVVAAANVTVRESRALVARSRGRPYLAAHSGERTIR